MSVFIADAITKLQKELSKNLHLRGIPISALLLADGQISVDCTSENLKGVAIYKLGLHNTVHKCYNRPSLLTLLYSDVNHDLAQGLHKS
jgi:hypothetical protein